MKLFPPAHTLITMRPLVHPSIQDITVGGVLHALSDPVRVAIYADIVAQDCSQNCSTFLNITEKPVPALPHPPRGRSHPQRAPRRRDAQPLPLPGGRRPLPRPHPHHRQRPRHPTRPAASNRRPIIPQKAGTHRGYPLGQICRGDRVPKQLVVLSVGWSPVRGLVLAGHQSQVPSKSPKLKLGIATGASRSEARHLDRSV
jgi:hypothetical protein